MLSTKQEIALISGCQVTEKRGTYFLKPDRKSLREVMHLLNKSGFCCTQSRNGQLEVTKHQKAGRDFYGKGPELEKSTRPESVGDSLTKHIKTETPNITAPTCPPGFYCVDKVEALFCWRLWYNDPVFGIQIEKISIGLPDRLEKRIQDCEDVGLVPVVPQDKFMSFRGLKLIFNIYGSPEVEQFESGEDRDVRIEELISIGLTRLVIGKKEESDIPESWLLSDKMNIR